MKAVIVAFACIVAVALAAGGEKPVNFFAQLVPSPDAAYKGLGGCGVNYDVVTMKISLGCNFLLLETGPADSTVAAHIHGPTAAAGTGDAGVVFTLSSTAGFTSPLLFQSEALTAAQEADLFANKYYINVHTTKKPDGAIRGFITAELPYLIASLDGAQNMVVGSPYSGGCSMAATTGTSYSLNCLHNIPVAQLMYAHVHGPSSGPGNNTGVLATICPSNTTCASPILAKVLTFTATQVGWIQKGLSYVNFHSLAHPNGEIRGQLNPIMKLTKPNRGAASSLTVGLPVIVSALVALFALRRA